MDNGALTTVYCFQAEMKCPLIIHPGRSEKAPYEIIDVLREAGADISKTVISHLDRTLLSCESLLKVTGTF